MEERVILRVISGTAKGHKLKTLKTDKTRPTSDKVKGALFSIIMGYIQDAVVLDLYAGTGSLGIEALSRGAKEAVFVDKREECIKIIEENLIHTKLLEKAKIIKGNVLEVLRKLSLEGRKYDLIFLDPPYNKDLITETLKQIATYDLLESQGIIIAEKDIKDEVPEKIGRLYLVGEHKYGDTVLARFKI